MRLGFPNCLWYYHKHVEMLDPHQLVSISEVRLIPMPCCMRGGCGENYRIYANATVVGRCSVFLGLKTTPTTVCAVVSPADLNGNLPDCVRTESRVKIIAVKLTAPQLEILLENIGLVCVSLFVRPLCRKGNMDHLSIDSLPYRY